MILMDLSDKEKFGLEKRNEDHFDSFCSTLYSQQTNLAGIPHFPTDNDFIERAARFSCFSGGSFSAMVSNHFIASEPLSTYPLDDDQRYAHAKRSNTTSDVTEVNGDKRRKRTNQYLESECDETAKEKLDTKQKKGEQNSSTQGTEKPKGKNSKDDGASGDYIHVRARRGQATNSHSLAERVRREKISERMKFLQELVPGCSKVTGKAVMLDEIINYVQSLQRQVEFLSMKLATVNPRLDLNIDGFMSKDLLQLRSGSPSAINFLPEMIHPQLHPQHGMVEAGIAGMNPSDALRRAISCQMPNAWEDELHNVIQINFGTNPSYNTPELNSKHHEDGFSL